MRYFLSLLFLIGCECACHAQVVRLYVTPTKGASLSAATAFYIGNTEDGNGIFATAKHVFTDGFHSGNVLILGTEYTISEPTLSEDEDVAIFEATGKPSRGLNLSTDAPSGEVDMPGYGPVMDDHSKRNVVRLGQANTETDVQLTSGRIVQGDSGCPAVTSQGVIGVVVGYYTDQPTVACVVPTRHLIKCLNRRYSATQCGPNGCPIYLRPRIQQPMIGIGLPIGPPRHVQEAVPVPRPPQVYVPQPRPEQPQYQTLVGPTGPRGEQGPAGKDGIHGRDGKDGKVDQASIETAIVTWLEANKEDLKGQTGLTGPAGRSVEKEDIQAAVNKWLAENFKQPTGSGEPVDLSSIESRLAAIEARKIRIVTSKGKVLVDDETYSGSQDDPIILNIDRILKAATTASK